VLERALAKSAAARYATGMQMIQAAQAAATGPAAAPTVRASPVAGVPVVPPPLPPQPASPAPAPASRGSRKAPWIGAAVVVAAAIAAGVLWTTMASPRAREAATTGGSSRVTTEQPGFIGRLLGAKPRLRVAVPAGSSIAARLETPLSSESARVGDAFTMAVAAPLEVEGHEAVPQGSRIKGHVAHAAGAGKVSGRGELTLEFDRIVSPDGREIPIEAEPLHRKARSTAKKDAAKVGGAAGAGAIIGAILGGKKGAAIGGAAGGAAGTGVVLSTRGEEVVLGAGTPVEVRLRSAFTVTIEPPSK
jgi:hypothetical protein